MCFTRYIPVYADINIFDKIPSLKNARIVFTCKKYCLHFYVKSHDQEGHKLVLFGPIVI